jgi:predicted nucleotidyltransferase component of viral defense system
MIAGRNVAASVRARLLNLAQKQGTQFNLILVRYGVERLLYRLSRSEHSSRFILKGAALFALWTEMPHRSTRDLDLLGFGDASLTTLAEIFRELCGVEVEDDGLRFEPASVSAKEIKSLDEYVGARIVLMAYLGTVRLPLQVDIGIGDAVVPPAHEVTYPTLLDHPAPRLRAYRMETVIAEKLHAIVVHGMQNTRMKDYFDLYYLSQRFNFDRESLILAIEATFKRRASNRLIELPLGLTGTFADNPLKATQWDAFLKRGGVDMADLSLHEVVCSIAEFISPLLSPDSDVIAWQAPGPWR